MPGTAKGGGVELPGRRAQPIRLHTGTDLAQTWHRPGTGPARSERTPMHRRSFLKTAALGAVAAAAPALAAPALAQGRTLWRMQTSPVTGPAETAFDAARLAARINTLSDGLLTVEAVPADRAAQQAVALDAVIAGQADMGHGPVQAWQSRAEALPFFAGMPYGLTAMEMASWLDRLGGNAVRDAVHDTFGVQAFLCGDTGPQAGGWFRTALAGIEDVQGLRLLSSGLAAQVWRKMGLSPVAMAADETLAALQAGALDGIEFGGPARDLAMGYQQECKHYHAVSFTKPAMAFELIVDKDRYLALPQDLREVLRVACAAAHRDSLAAAAAQDAAALHSLMTTHGVTVYPTFPDSILQAGGKAAAEVFTALRDSSDPLARRTAESYLAALAILRQKADGADATYHAARARFLQI